MRVTGGRFKNQILTSPKGKQTRPTSERLRETIFNIIQGAIEGKTFLDLFAGSGAVGIEAISRGASFATFIEQDRNAIYAIKENLKKLGLHQQTQLLRGDVPIRIKHLKGGTFDYIFIDPPYEKGFQERTLLLIDELALLAPQGVIFVEESINHEWVPPTFSTFQFQKKRKVGSTFLYEFVSSSVKLL